MSSQQLDEEAIFHLARKIPDPEDRETYLDQVCAGDQQLRDRVEALLDAHERESKFLKSSPEAAPTADHKQITEGPGQQIGRFKLLQQIGEGGFGVVYMAEQVRPVRRKVALKIIKPGMDTHAVVARFEAERQALAMMDHPNIARVLDGGATDSGRPYFVMELVRGVPITEYCDKNNLPTNERLELFTIVCQAVQHAHQKGIIHRDLKPSNILVTLADGKPVVKVIDFGVSKALNQQLTEKTLFTAYGQMIGTPQYMSPEQAEMSCLDVDTRSDIYSLGVVLYELLTGTTPLEGERLRTAGFAAMQRIIQEEEPPKPSVRLSTSGEKLTVVAKHRSATPERLHKILKGDLDWIVMKALGKDRQERYSTASGFAEDVLNYLNNEPVHACPPSVVYRCKKFAKRNRRLVLAGTSVFSSLLLVAVGTSVGLLEVNHSRILAEQASEEARRLTDSEREARLRLSQNLDDTENRLYAARMNQTANAWRRNDIAFMRVLLDGYADSDLRQWEWYFLNGLASDNEGSRTVSVDDKTIRISVSPRGDVIAAGHPNRAAATLVNARTGRPINSWGKRRIGTWESSFVEFSPDGKQLARLGDDLVSVVIQDLEANTVTSTKKLDSLVWYATFAPNRDSEVAVVSGSGTLTLFDTKSPEAGDRTVELTNANWGSVLAYSPDGSILVHGGQSIDVVDVATLRVVETLKGHDHEVTDVEFVDGGKYLASASVDGTVAIWDTNTWEAFTLGQFSDQVRSLAYSSQRQVLAAGVRDRTIRFWSVPEFEYLGESKGYSGNYGLAFTPPGEIVYARQDSAIVIDPELVREPNPTILAIGKSIEDAAFACDNRLLVAFETEYGSDSVLRLIDTSRSIAGETRTISLDFRGARMASSNDVCAIGHSELCEVRIYELPSGKMRRSITSDSNGSVQSLAFSMSGDLLAAGLTSGEVLVWDVQTCREVLPPKNLHSEGVTCVGFLADGEHIVTGSGDGSLAVVDLRNSGRVVRLEQMDGWIHELSCSNTGSFAFSVFNPAGHDLRQDFICEKNAPIRPFRGHTFSTRGLKHLGDGKTLVSVGGDGTLKLFDTQRLESRLTIEMEDIGECVAVASDDSIIAIGTRRGAVYLFHRDR